MSPGLYSSVCLVAISVIAGVTGFSWPWSSTRDPPKATPPHALGSIIKSSSVSHHTKLVDGTIMMEWRSKPPRGAYAHRTVDPSNMICRLDPKVTASTILDFQTEIGELWGGACGRNRGVFILEPADGKTYDCGNLPESWGIPNVGSLLSAQPAKAVTALTNYISAVYNSTVVKGPSACDFNALAYLTCGREEPWRTVPWYNKIKNPIRAVNIGGLFVLEQWILPGFVTWGEETGIWDQYTFSSECKKMDICDQLKQHWETWYSADDFLQMKKFGLNTIRLPVGYWYFAERVGLNPAPYLVPDQDLFDAHHPITNVIRWADEAGLQVILDLHGAPYSQNGLDNSGRMTDDPNVHNWGETWLYDETAISETVQILSSMALYIKFLSEEQDLDNVMMLELVNEPWVFLDMGMVRDFYILAISSVRAVLPDMPILLHDSFHGDMWAMMLKYFPFDNVYMDTHIYHGFNPSDIASDSYQADKQKMYVHERMSCAMTSMLRYETCSAAPTITGEFSLAIDNCMDAIDRKFQNYGQCDRIARRSTDPWWKDHIRSFAHRQMDVYERELGWSFWTYKLDKHAETTAESAPLWSFRLAVKEGYIDTSYPPHACRYDPVADWQDKASTATPASKPAPDSAPADEGAVSKPKLAREQDAKTEAGEDADLVLLAPPEEATGGRAPQRMSASTSPGWVLFLVSVAALIGAGVLLAHRYTGGRPLSVLTTQLSSAMQAVLPSSVHRGQYETVGDSSMPVGTQC